MIVELLVLGVVIGSNNLATALALGSLGQQVRRWRIVSVFGVFEFCIPLLGMLLGRRAAAAFEDMFNWLGPALLALLGGWVILSATRPERDAKALASRVTSWWGLIALSAGLSIDNLIVGFSLGLRDIPPVILASTIAVISMVFATIGLRVGQHASATHRRATRMATGALLIGLAIAVLLGVL